MPIKSIPSSINVLDAARLRIRNAFSNGCKMYLSFSCGKDSACMAQLTYDLILEGAIDPKQLTVTFIDEEGLYPSMVQAAMYWRKRFIALQHFTYSLEMGKADAVDILVVIMIDGCRADSSQVSEILLLHTPLAQQRRKPDANSYHTDTPFVENITKFPNENPAE